MCLTESDFLKSANVGAEPRGAKVSVRGSPGRRVKWLSENSPGMPNASTHTENAGLSVVRVTVKSLLGDWALPTSMVTLAAARSRFLKMSKSQPVW